ncbi:uncharacterized protein BO97DRAFT_449285 [Aspergillus homomorphus CBS 101889]|uniref:NACHT domain-containing protein n=1 Tax=Aspergillus homomorphus (strain CBS 101889) TaxID=1450537 RepID=A0A395I125_ASPHC|nr:hypothetical protein BO97DRAFT_449285 [Aspergillus homomorphus CBS 101889]RAL13891.1 hypothetical protein BO97DRAFT_449285 [Aspergillus homomorphus CBS 101889]
MSLASRLDNVTRVGEGEWNPTFGLHPKHSGCIEHIELDDDYDEAWFVTADKAWRPIFARSYPANFDHIKLHGEKFNHWLAEEEGAFFHITGQPGSGKSQLLAEIGYTGSRKMWVEGSWTKTNSNSKKIRWSRVFFYKYQKEPREHDPLMTMMRGILASLFGGYRDESDQKLVPLLFPERAHMGTIPARHPQYSSPVTDGRVPDWEELINQDYVIDDEEVLSAWKNLLESDAIYEDRKIFLVLDGLNKLDPAHHSAMIANLKEWADARPGDVKICISSRGEEEFQKAFRSCSGYDLGGVNFTKMVLYAHNQLATDGTLEGVEGLERFVRIPGTEEEEKKLEHRRAVNRHYTSLATTEEQHHIERKITQMAQTSFSCVVEVVKALVNEDILACNDIDDISKAIEKRVDEFRNRDFDADMV